MMPFYLHVGEFGDRLEMDNIVGEFQTVVAAQAAFTKYQERDYLGAILEADEWPELYDEVDLPNFVLVCDREWFKPNPNAATFGDLWKRDVD